MNMRGHRVCPYEAHWDVAARRQEAAAQAECADQLRSELAWLDSQVDEGGPYFSGRVRLWTQPPAHVHVFSQGIDAAGGQQPCYASSSCAACVISNRTRLQVCPHMLPSNIAIHLKV